MFESAQIMVPAQEPLAFWLAQMPVGRGMVTPEQASLVFSGPAFFMALISGVLLAFGFQLLLTNLSVAAGISYLGRPSRDERTDERTDEQTSLGGTIRQIETKLGMWTLISVSLALFFGCLLAVKLSLITSIALGAILGLVIWGAYFSLLVLLSATTVGSLVGSAINTATAGFQAIAGTAAAALGAKAARDQVVSTAEAAAAAVRREFGSAIDPAGLRDTVEDYIAALKPPELDIQGIRREFEKLLSDTKLTEIADSGELPNIDRQTFVDLVSSRTDLSKRDINRIAEQLEDAWKQTTSQMQKPADGMAQLIKYLREAKPGELLSSQLTQRLDQLIDEFRQRRKAENPSMMSQAMMAGFNALMGIVLGRTDLSELDAQTIVEQLKAAKDRASQQAGKVASQVTVDVPARPASTLRADVENYLLNTYSWEMTPEKIDRNFREVLYDPEADPAMVRRELEQLSRSDFAETLASRGVFTRDRIQLLARQLESIRLQVLYTAAAAFEREKTEDLQRRVGDYLRWSKKEDLNPEAITRDFRALLADEEAGYDQLRNRFRQFDRAALAQTLSHRNDLSAAEAEAILSQLERIRDQILQEARTLEESASNLVEAQWQKLQSYLRSTGKQELNPEGIKRDLQALLESPQTGVRALRMRLAQFDRDTLVALLSGRQDLSAEQLEGILDSVESAWKRVASGTQAAAGQAKEQYDRVLSAIADYLRSTGKQELNPEGIQRDLTQLLRHPKQGAMAIRDRLAGIDRATWVRLVSQRQDLSEAEVSRIIDSVQQTIGSFARAPRRLAVRAQQQVRDFQSTLEDYLRSTGIEELNPEAIKRDIHLLLHDPQVGAQSLAERLSHIDRPAIVRALSGRPDISEEEANRIADQIFSVRDQFVGQIESVRERIRSLVDGILARIRDYLNSLNRPELNYEGIRRDVRKLFSDPQAGFEALRDRLSHLNRDTLVAIISSREDISEADANRIVGQIEAARNSVLQRAEQLQLEAQRRLDDLKLQAQQQAEETRKAAETAAWWLFGTALVSALASAGGGALAVLTLAL
ncbi:hypothetical protein [Kamptonema formosum]|uniref:hypothetical protein n=1 Tax=Kamptonema formosum TaxID=331992 RepID=UPI00034C3AF7|nr:hypothetical protein [Oscillatoria sp. PCC 10802]